MTSCRQKRDEQRSGISSAQDWYRYSKNTLAEYPGNFYKLSRELKVVRAEITQFLEDRPKLERMHSNQSAAILRPSDRVTNLRRTLVSVSQLRWAVPMLSKLRK